MTPIVVIASKSGRLGNRLFQSAHFMGNALTKGYRLLNPSLGEYAHLFEGSTKDPLCGFPAPWKQVEPELAAQCRDMLYQSINLFGLAVSKCPIPGVSAIDIRHLDESEEGGYEMGGESFGKLLESAKVLLPMGWKFSDHEGIRRHREEIIRYFTPIKSVRKSAESVVLSARESGHKVIGVHIRQEDYRFWKGGVHYYETSQYVRWMRRCEDFYPGGKPVFVVCASNDLDPFEFSGINVVKGPGSPLGDLHSLSLCDQIMGPPSTFSAWASYYGNVPLLTLMNKNQKIDREAFVLHY